MPSFHDAESVCRHERVSNRVAGKVVAIHQGLVRTTVRLAVGNRVELRSRSASAVEAEAPVRIGERLHAEIDAEAVLLGVPSVWPGRERWNRWTGRIVLVEPHEPAGLVTVKVKGESWTLKSKRGVMDAQRFPRTWDPVNIVVDPEAVRLSHETLGQAPRGYAWTVGSPQRTGAGRVLMKGRVRSARLRAAGSLVTIEVGTAVVSALITDADEPRCNWEPGMTVDLSVGELEAWVKPSDQDGELLRCDLLYMVPDEESRVVVREKSYDDARI